MTVLPVTEAKTNFYQDLVNPDHENAELDITFTLEDDGLKPV
nr:MAG TPA: hypothetical protein [Caudoviricetes sp.]